MENFSDLNNICLQIFQQVSQTTSIFLVPLFMTRIILANTVGEGSEAFSILKSAAIYFILIAAFPFILEILFSIPESYLPKLQDITDMESLPEDKGLNLIPFALDNILEVLLAALYWLAYYLHIFFMILMSSMAPVIFLTSTLLGVGIGIEIFMGLLIIGSSWPILWHGLDQVHAQLSQAQVDSFGAKCLELLVTVMKALAPVTLSALVLKSPAGQTISKSIRGAAALGQASINKFTQSSSSRQSSHSSSFKQSPSFGKSAFASGSKSHMPNASSFNKAQYRKVMEENS